MRHSTIVALIGIELMLGGAIASLSFELARPIALGSIAAARATTNAVTTIASAATGAIVRTRPHLARHEIRIVIGMPA